MLLVVFVINTRWQEFKTQWLKEQEAKNKEVVDAGGVATEPVIPPFFSFISGGTSNTNPVVEEANKDYLIDTLQQKYPSYVLTYQERQLLKAMSVPDLQSLINMSNDEFEVWLSGVLGYEVQIG